jgi:hypothetical protein
MNWFTFTASMHIDWRDKHLVYVKADDIKSAYDKLDNAGFADYRFTDRPSVYSHLENHELR